MKFMFVQRSHFSSRASVWSSSVLPSLIAVLVVQATGCDGDTSVVEQLRDANIILAERDEVSEEFASYQTTPIKVMFNLGSKAVNDIATFKTIYVAPCQLVDKILDGEKQYHIQQLSNYKLALRELSKMLVEENETQRIVGLEIDEEFPGMKVAANAITNKNSQLTSRQKISATTELLGKYELYMNQINLRLTPITLRIQELEREIEQTNQEIETLQRSLGDMAWFERLPVNNANNFSVNVGGTCTIQMPKEVDSYIWTTASVSADNMAFDQQFRWFLRCPDAIDDAGILSLTTETGVEGVVAKDAE